MKERIVRFGAMLLILWYCFSIMGFNVHTCNASGRSFVATFISGLSCEDIHPCHACDHDHCGKGFKDSCCHDDHVVLTITGCSLEDNHRQHDSNIQSSPFACITAVPVLLRQVLPSTDHIFFKPVSWLIARGDRQSLLNIWRI